MEPNDLMLWVESHGALVAGDTLQDRGNGLQFLGDLANNVPAERGVAAEQILEGMQPLLALPVEIVLLDARSAGRSSGARACARDRKTDDFSPSPRSTSRVGRNRRAVARH